MERAAPEAMKPISWIAIVACWFRLVAATIAAAGEVAAVRGVVLDTTGNPIAGATVTLGSRKDTTGDDGVFFFDDVPLGAHQVAATAWGKSVSKPVTVDRSKVHEVSIVVDRDNQPSLAKSRGIAIPVEGIVTYGAPAPRDERVAIEVFGPSTLGGADVWVLGPHAEPVAKFPNPSGSANNPRWSPDGKAIVYHNRLPRNRGNEIWLIDIVNVRERKIADGTTPSFSPDGAMVVFSAMDQGNWDIYALSLASGEKRQLTQTPGNELFPLWQATAAGGRILFSARNDAGGPDDRATYDLWQIDPDGKNRKRLTTLGQTQKSRVFGVSNALAGDTIAFWLWRKDGPPDLWRSKGDGSGARLVLKNAANPEWGRREEERTVIYYTSDEEGRQQLWRFDTTIH